MKSHIPACLPGYQSPSEEAAISHWEDVVERRSEMMRLWLSRVPESHLLDVDLSLTSGPPSKRQSKGAQIVADILIERSTQWKRLHLSTSRECSKAILSTPTSAVPNLQHLTLALSEYGQVESELLQDDSKLVGAPNLRTVQLFGHCPVLKIALQWSLLTSVDVLNVWSFTDLQAWNLLNRCPLLVHCGLSIAARTIRDPSLLSNAQISMSSLTSLHLRHCTADSMEHIFSSIKFPQLKTFRISQSDNTNKTLSLIIQRCSSALEHLHLQVLRITPKAFVEVITQCALLKSLSVSYTPYGAEPLPIISNALLVALTPPMSEPVSGAAPCESVACEVACPDLQSIDFFINLSGPQRISDHVIFEFIKARRALATPTLGTIRVEHTEHFQEMDVIAKLKEANVDIRGVDIDLQYRSRREGVL